MGTDSGWPMVLNDSGWWFDVCRDESIAGCIVLWWASLGLKQVYHSSSQQDCLTGQSCDTGPRSDFYSRQQKCSSHENNYNTSFDSETSPLLSIPFPFSYLVPIRPLQSGLRCTVILCWDYMLHDLPALKILPVRRFHEKKGHRVGGKELRWLWIITLCRHVSVWLMHAELTVHLNCLDSPSHLKHHIYAVSPFCTFITPFLDVFLAILSCLDGRCWGRLCHITDRWITRGKTCSTAGQCRFPWPHKYTNKHMHIQKHFDITQPLTESTYTVVDEYHPYRQSCLPINAPHAKCLCDGPQQEVIPK